jgi:hypothetical protein
MSELQRFHVVCITRGGRKRPPVTYEATFNTMFNMVEGWVQNGYYENEEDSSIVQLGAGAAVHLLSEAVLQMVQRSGIIVGKWNVVIETPDGSVMPPLPYEQREDAVLAVKTALQQVWPMSGDAKHPEPLCRVKTPDHEAFWYAPMPGTTYLILDSEACVARMKNPIPGRSPIIM